MFDLEQAITEWRKEMLSAGIKTPAPLDELESHLRDDVEQQIRLGLDVENALKAAVRRIGQADALKHEFKKVVTNERKTMKKMIIIALGIIGVLVGPAFVLPALAQYRHEGSMTNESVGLFILGLIITLAGIIAAFRTIKRRSA